MKCMILRDGCHFEIEGQPNIMVHYLIIIIIIIII